MIEVPLTALFSDTAGLVLVAMGVFARVGAAAFLVPGLGERSLSTRIRLMASLAITLMLVPLIRGFETQAPEERSDCPKTEGWKQSPPLISFAPNAVVPMDGRDSLT